MSLIVSGATLLDGVADRPLEGRAIWIEDGRIKAIAAPAVLGEPPGAQVIDARGKYVIPGLMDANVHLFGATTLERLAHHAGCYEDIVAEAAQIALKGGLTTVFDTWGPRQTLMAVRDRINAGKLPGSRIFCAGNIIGFDGLFSPDFFAPAAEVASAGFSRRINALFAENVGRHLMWLTPEAVAQEVRAYISKGIDFAKYASNEHGAHSAGAFIAFSPQVQAAIVEQAHLAGITAQAHTMSVEGLRIAVEAGCNLIQHANTTGPVPIPETTLELMARRKTGAVVFPLTHRRLEWLMEIADETVRCVNACKNVNARNLIASEVPLLMAWDAMVTPPEIEADPRLGKYRRGVDDPGRLGCGHLHWFKAMDEMGCAPMAMLKAATRNVAVAYGKDKDLGTLEPGKIADLLILDKDPLQSTEHYGAIHTIVKDGVVVDRDVLPLNPVLTRPMALPAGE